MFRTVLHVLRNASPEDEVHFHINSGGGSLYTAVQICSAMFECQAKNITCHAEGIVASAATLIFLSGSTWKVSPLSTFMFHTSTSVEHGKMPDMIKSIDAHKQHLNVVSRTIYEDFLSEDEIDAIINKNDDVWMTPAEVEKRLNVLIEKSNERLEAISDDEEIEIMSDEEIQEELESLSKKQVIEAYNEMIQYVKEGADIIDTIPATTKQTKQKIIDKYIEVMEEYVKSKTK